MKNKEYLWCCLTSERPKTSKIIQLWFLMQYFYFTVFDMTFWCWYTHIHHLNYTPLFFVVVNIGRFWVLSSRPLYGLSSSAACTTLTKAPLKWMEISQQQQTRAMHLLSTRKKDINWPNALLFPHILYFCFCANIFLCFIAVTCCSL